MSTYEMSKEGDRAVAKIAALADVADNEVIGMSLGCLLLIIKHQHKGGSVVFLNSQGVAEAELESYVPK